MEGPKTPINRVKSVQDVCIPASPFMKKIGFGTGVAVYEMKRSPITNQSNSPWAVKKVLSKNKSNPEAFVKDIDGRHILAMEECSNCLGDLIEECTEPFPSKTITKVTFDVSKALEYLHNHSLLMHCDVKSYNILIKGDFNVCKLCDFGVCLPVTKTGELNEEKAGSEAEYIGTAAWSAPEILKFPQEITTKADIYAFGLVIWEMIALMPPADEEFVNSFNNLSFDEEVSEDSLDLSATGKTRKRPPLPDFDLTDDYNLILEVFFICTEDDKSKRPTAKDLTAILTHINKHSQLK
ncbi:hypothetical protein NQ317_004422 [Molorchus minor]|uniref:mitogen-activated protein kinase kinase n=1 Tax=Molorchus minor TaxID=1323400 RepID=A0ABQ9JAS3_9CUCU|nr:hypothetical protein NQ317_004422 [Molorchus minor]